MSAVVADSVTVQAVTSLAMAPKPRLFFLTTASAVPTLCSGRFIPLTTRLWQAWVFARSNNRFGA